MHVWNVTINGQTQICKFGAMKLLLGSQQPSILHSLWFNCLPPHSWHHNSSHGPLGDNNSKKQIRYNKEVVRGQSILNTPDKVRPGIELIFLGVDILAGGLLCWVAFSNFDTDLHNVCRWLPLAPSPYLKPVPDNVLIDSLM